MHEDRRHQPPYLAVRDVIESVVAYPSIGVKSFGCKKKAVLDLTSFARILEQENNQANRDECDGQWAALNAWSGPQIGNFAKVLAKLLVEHLFLAPDCLSCLVGIAIKRIVGMAQEVSQFVAGPRDLILVIDPQVPTLRQVIDAGLDAESQEVVG